MTGTVEGERTAQATGDTSIHTGGISFGGGQLNEGNPYLVAANKFKMVALVLSGLIAALIVYKKVK